MNKFRNSGYGAARAHFQIDASETQHTKVEREFKAPRNLNPKFISPKYSPGSRPHQIPVALGELSLSDPKTETRLNPFHEQFQIRLRALRAMNHDYSISDPGNTMQTVSKSKTVQPPNSKAILPAVSLFLLPLSTPSLLFAAAAAAATWSRSTRNWYSVLFPLDFFLKSDFVV